MATTERAAPAGRYSSVATSWRRRLAAAPHPTIGRSMNIGAATHGSHSGIRGTVGEGRELVGDMRKSRPTLPTATWVL